MLPSDMYLKIKTGTVRYNNKILVSDEKFSVGENENVNENVPAIKSHKVTQTATNSNDVLSHTPNISHKNPGPKTITHNDEKIALVLALSSGFVIWNIFLWKFNKMYGSPAEVFIIITLTTCQLV